MSESLFLIITRLVRTNLLLSRFGLSGLLLMLLLKLKISFIAVASN